LSKKLKGKEKIAQDDFEGKEMIIRNKKEKEKVRYILEI
jgi:hypothetical protein